MDLLIRLLSRLLALDVKVIINTAIQVLFVSENTISALVGLATESKDYD